ncbi:DDE_3 domain-containing protein [Trichonephila clavipes]|nr:DDE_3 domain-containing protein [Trichonephila clavipes]
MRRTLTGQRYVDDILRPHVGPFLNGLPGVIFQQDNARPYTARVAQDFLRSIIIKEQSLMSVGYVDFIVGQVHLFMVTAFPVAYGVYQQNSALCHKGRILRKWFEEHSSEFHIMFWLPNSSDMNPIEIL